MIKMSSVLTPIFFFLNPTREFPSSCLLFDFFHQCLTVFRVQICFLLTFFISRYSILFDAVVNGNSSFRSVVVSVVGMQEICCINFVSCSFTEFIDEL